MGPSLELWRKSKRNQLRVFVIVIYEEAPDPGNSSLLQQTPVDSFPAPLSKRNNPKTAWFHKTSSPHINYHSRVQWRVNPHLKFRNSIFFFFFRISRAFCRVYTALFVLGKFWKHKYNPPLHCCIPCEAAAVSTPSTHARPDIQYMNGKSAYLLYYLSQNHIHVIYFTILVLNAPQGHEILIPRIHFVHKAARGI